MPELAWLVTQVTCGHEGLENPIGIGQGSPYSPIAVENLLHHTLDVEFGMKHPGIPLYRYVDNINALVQSPVIGLQIRESMASNLRTSGLNLKGEGETIIDLRDPRHSTSVLGLIPRWSNNQLSFEIPDKAINKLEDNLDLATVSDHPRWTADLAITGWIRACGPAMTDAVQRVTIPRIIHTAKRKGFIETQAKPLHEIARRSRKQWETITRD
jgi:hypothetical protein